MARSRSVKPAAKPLKKTAGAKTASRTAAPQTTQKEPAKATSNPMILQVDEATRGLMNEIKNGITEGFSSGPDYSDDISSIRENISQICGKLDDCSSDISSVKNSAGKAADSGETTELRLGKLEKDIRKLSDAQNKISEKLDQILELLDEKRSNRT